MHEPYANAHLDARKAGVVYRYSIGTYAMPADIKYQILSFRRTRGVGSQNGGLRI